jgi:adenosylmethionine-8-amino-7-oxononanoate aminotransferase
MSDLIVLGTDTDTGKTTFALLWMTAFVDRYAYWKPVETGDSDTACVRRFCPLAIVWDPVARFAEPVAPPLAARREGRPIPSAAEITLARPAGDLPLLIETFGGPLSPVNETELQLDLIHRLARPAVLVASSALGAVGRTLAVLRVLGAGGCEVRAVALVGPADPYAEAEIEKHGGLPVVGLRPPARWDRAGLAAAVAEQRTTLDRLRSIAEPVSEPVDSPTELVRRDRAAVWHPYTALADPDDPLPVVGTRNEFLELADGRRLIDGTSSWWTILHGHRHPRLMAALHRASQQVDHVLFAGATHPFAVECAEELLKTAPWTGGRVFFSDNGSTAVEVALKMVYQYWCHRGEPRRTLFVGFEGGYHGDTFGAMAVGRDPVFFGRFEPLLFGAARVPVVPDLLDAFLAKHHHEVAAVVIEPLIQAAGGMRLHSPDILRDLYAVARRYRVLFIADEVMTAFRTGTVWAHTQAGIAPDFICAAKTLAGGILPLAATLVAPEVVAAFDTADRGQTFFHGHSFTGHPLACAVAAENLRLLADGRWRTQAERICKHWQGARMDWQASCDELGKRSVVDNPRVCGTVLALDVGRGGYLADVGRRMRAAAIEAGVLLRPLGNVLYALPPLDASDESLGRILDAMRAAVRAAGG